MGDFPGYSQVSAVLTRLRSELKKTVLEAAAPRLFDTDWLPTGGGYGLTLPATDLPENWGAGRISATIDTLCPILEAWRYANADSGEGIEDTHLTDVGFTAADVYGTVDTDTGENFRGCGYMLLEQEGGRLSEEYDNSGQRFAEACNIRVAIRVPRGFGQGQAQLYAGLLARVLRDRVIGLGTDGDALQFGWVPEMGQIEEESPAWLGLIWTAEAIRFYY